MQTAIKTHTYLSGICGTYFSDQPVLSLYIHLNWGNLHGFPPPHKVWATGMEYNIVEPGVVNCKPGSYVANIHYEYNRLALVKEAG